MTRILIVTSCTGEKLVKHERALTLQDFEQGAHHLKTREQALAEWLTPAGKMYTGLQHVRLMQGIAAFQQVTADKSPRLDLWILSAGYGLISQDRSVAPYECTFQGMKKTELRSWANQLNVPADMRRLLAEPYDLALILLGDSYLEACQLDEAVQLGGPTLIFCGANTAKRLPNLAMARTIILTNQDARRFSCGLVGLKGEVAARLLKHLSGDLSQLDQLIAPATDVLALLDQRELAAHM